MTKIQLIHYANDILQMWHNVIADSERIEDWQKRSWHKVDLRQGYQDAMNGLRAHGLIDEFDVDKIRVQIDGVWYADRRHLEFIPS
jgi:hypothetical protein